jgi:outer membrane protein assembly factor BamB
VEQNMKISRYKVMAAVSAAVLAGLVRGQMGGLPTQEWSTSGGDAQRSSWIRRDALISKNAMATGKFGFLWKLKLNNQPRQLSYLSQPVLVGNAMGFRGFRSLTVLAGASNTVFAVDNDFGAMYWEKHFAAALPASSTSACPGGMTAAATRATNPNPAALSMGRAGNRSPYRGTLGEPGAGVALDSPSGGRGGRANAAALGAAAGAARGPAAAPAGPGRGRGPATAMGARAIAVLAGDGVLHFVSPVSAKELLEPMPFIPANANATDLAWVGGIVYTATVGECGGVPNAVWAIDPLAETRQVISWKTNGGSVTGTLAFGSDGVIYVAIGRSRALDGGYADAVVALDPLTLKVKDWFQHPGADFVSTPIVFQSKGRDFLAEVAGDGRIFLLDAASLGGADHKTALQITPASSGARAGVFAAALASWEGESGMRWLLAPSAAPASANRFATTNGAVTNAAITAYRVKPGANPSLEPAWVSRDMIAPLPPIVVNGVIYAASSGEYNPGDAGVSNADRARRSSPAMLYALDATTGKEMWNSGSTMTAFAHGTGLASSPGQVYLATSDNTVYAFGMPYERQ